MSPWVMLAALSLAAASWLATDGSRALAMALPPVGPQTALARLVERVEGLPVVAAAREAVEAHGASIESLSEVPQMLDILCLGLSAGLSFDGALAIYVERGDTRLSRRMGRARTSWQLGLRERSEALDEVARELGVEALSRFASTVEESLRFGMPLAQTLRRQAQAIRDEQRQRIEEEVERVPVKMLLPLGCLVVPAMLLAIVGPLLASALSG